MELGWLFHWRVGALSPSRYPCQRGISAWRGGSQPNDPSSPSRWLTSYEFSIVMLKPIFGTHSSQLLGNGTAEEFIGFLSTLSWCHRFVEHTSCSTSGVEGQTIGQVRDEYLAGLSGTFERVEQELVSGIQVGSSEPDRKITPTRRAARKENRHLNNESRTTTPPPRLSANDLYGNSFHISRRSSELFWCELDRFADSTSYAVRLFSLISFSSFPRWIILCIYSAYIKRQEWNVV